MRCTHSWWNTKDPPTEEIDSLRLSLMTQCTLNVFDIFERATEETWWVKEGRFVLQHLCCLYDVAFSDSDNNVSCRASTIFGPLCEIVVIGHSGATMGNY